MYSTSGYRGLDTPGLALPVAPFAGVAIDPALGHSARPVEKPEPQRLPLPSAPPVAPVFPYEELVIVAAYLLLAGLWIVFSDLALDKLTGDPAESLRLQTAKGLNFVVTTAGLLYLVLRRTHHRRRLAEQRLRGLQERFELVARASNDLIWDLDLRTQEVWYSQGFSKLLGESPLDQRSALAAWLEHVHPEDRERVQASVLASVERGDSTWVNEYRVRRDNGSYALVHGEGFVVRDSAGRALRLAGGIRDVTERRLAERRLRDSQARLRALSARIHSLREEEHTRISREIHDQLGQLLTGTKMDLVAAQRHLEELPISPTAGTALDRVVSALELVDRTIESVQRIAAELRPGMLDQLGLFPAVREELARLEARGGLTCRCDLPAIEPSLSRDQATVCYRVLQEALTNVVRHAQATEVTVCWRAEPGAIRMEITDNGQGMDPGTVHDPRSLGLLGMQERAAMVGGDVAWSGAEPRGTRVILTLPTDSSP